MIVDVPASAGLVFMKQATYTANYNNRNHIYASGSDNCIEENLVANSTNRIKVSDSGNIIIKNRARANTATPQPLIPDGNYDIRIGLFALNITRHCVSAFYRNAGIFF